MTIVTMWRTAAAAALAAALASPAAGAGDPEALIDALQQKDRQSLRALIKGGADVNARRADGATPLMWAAHWDDAQGARMLIAAGARANAANDHGVTPLDLACENGNVEMVRLLVAARADVNAVQKSGITPLMTAARTGSAEIVKLLLASGADVNAAGARTAQTALMWAISDRHRDVVRLLLEAGASPNVSSSRGFTPLMYTALHGDIEIGKLLIARGADVNARGSKGDSALPLAIVAANDAFALFLLDQGAHPGGAVGGVRALHAAAAPVDPWLKDWLYHQNEARQTLGLSLAARIALVKALLARGADVNGRITSNGTAAYYLAPQNGAFDDASTGTGNMKGATPLFVAAFAYADEEAQDDTPDEGPGASTAIVRLLLDAGADPNAAADDGSTPLMAAAGVALRARSGADLPNAGLERARVLIDAGAQVNAANEAKFTALHRAAFVGNQDVIRHLVAKGAPINAQDYRGRTPFRIAEGTKNGFQLIKQPAVAKLFEQLGADTTLGPSWDAFERDSRKTLDKPAGQD